MESAQASVMGTDVEAGGVGPLAGRAFHLIGVGGAGMSVVAQLLAGEGAQVTGSDAVGGAALDRLARAGLGVYVGHRSSGVPPLATVVVSTAIKPDNPELVVARERGQEVIHRSQALALAAGQRRFVAVAGAHGKTTTSGMLAQALTEVGADPSFAVGGVVSAMGTGAHVGAGDVLVAEADESDRSFLNYRPAVEVVLNVEPDHLDHYGTREAFEQAFVDFAHRLVPGGLLVACVDDDGAARLAGRVRGQGVRVVTWGTQPPEQVAAEPESHVQVRVREHSGAGSRAELVRWTRCEDGTWRPGERVELVLAQPGAHVVLDAAGAWAAGTELGVDGERMAQALGAFAGTGRRFERRGEACGVLVVDDYAHHPTEIEALVRSAREVAAARGGHLRLVFQPHLFSRTQAFAERFAGALAGAHEAVVIGVYPARETQADFPTVTGATIVEAAAGAAAEAVAQGRLRYEADAAAAVRELVAHVGPGDVVVTVGAGDVTALGPVILEELAGRCGEGSGA